MRAAIYVRVSTDEQAEDGYSLQAQQRMCRLWAEMRGWEVGEVYQDDGYSGRTSDRPAFQQLIADVKAKRCNVVIIHKLDRFARNLHLMLELINAWDQQGVGFVSVTEQMDFSTPMGRMVLQILGAVAEWYSNNLGLETKKGLAEKARQGKWVGPVPLGYQRAENGVLIRSEDAVVVIMIYELYATGNYSYVEIADILNAAGHRSLKWQTGERILFGRESVRFILRNRAYCGYVTSGGQEFRGGHEPLVSEELWRRCEAIRDGRTEKGGKASIRSAGVLTQLVYCARCGQRMWYHYSGRHGKHRYYQCSGNGQRTCDAPLANATVIEQQAFEMLRSLSIPSKWYDTIVDRAQKLLEVRRSPQVVDRAAVEEQLRRLGIAYADGVMGDIEYRHRRDKLRAMLKEAPEPISRPALQDATELLGNLPRLVEKATEEKRRGLARQLFSHFWVEKREIRAITPTRLYLPLLGVLATGMPGAAGQLCAVKGNKAPRPPHPAPRLEGDH